MPARRLVVRGRVQGVNFRDATRRVAREQGVGGWVRNRADGAVEVHLEGEPAAMAALEEWIAGGGPRAARVTDVERQEVAEEGHETFEVRA